MLAPAELEEPLATVDGAWEDEELPLEDDEPLELEDEELPLEDELDEEDGGPLG